MDERKTKDVALDDHSDNLSAIASNRRQVYRLYVFGYCIVQRNLKMGELKLPDSSRRSTCFLDP